ncbi:prolyl oligopeptidase family serine peptidase [Bdellovibrio sp. HCB2-146]|uniref:prolyl oligopeptidase family serine peptidase n=1 Tax=Bdellovibrio sp. HCB2-146 TaxID=3394362 RepID=UPI0039BCBA9E
MFRYLISILVVSIATLAQAAVPECHSKMWGELEANYCTNAPNQGDSDTLLVYFHGLGGSEREWFTEPSLQTVQKQLAAKKFDPWVITVSFGPGWLLTTVPNGYLLFPKIMDELLPELEKRIKPIGFSKKILVGASMGGFNTSQVLLKRPDAFQKYLLICPAITEIGPYSSESEVLSYIRRTGASPNRIAFMLEWGRQEFPTLQDWNEHAPVTLAKGDVRLPRVYISCGTKDDYGFQEGSFALFNALKSKAHHSEWVPVKDGRHCAADAKSIVKFITEN